MYAAVRVIKATYRSLLADGRTWILAQPISLICFLKDVNNSYFFVYHEELIGPLKTIIMARNHGPMLDSVALECAALVAAAVDDQKCASDCSEMMHAIMGRFDEHLGDTKEKYLFPSRQGMFSTSLAALAVAMGPAFLPFLPAVMNSSIGAIRTPVFENEDGRRYVENFVAIDRKKGVACDVILKLVHQLR
ncbi:hypothetical protein PRIPAC_86764, partial [Pristionchus pacificus]|uniref:Uncharacterized protein n=1 Tax=Pristionchus pacificus TaxID=54126 RepID=A0A2A6BSS2_PRIPA